jgi:hypothetical protein
LLLRISDEKVNCSRDETGSRSSLVRYTFAGSIRAGRAAIVEVGALTGERIELAFGPGTAGAAINT